MSDTRKLAIEALTDLAARALAAAGASAANAASVSRALVAAEIDGQKGHGLWRVPSYAAQVTAGKIDGQAVPQATHVRRASVMIDAGRGFAYPAFDLAIAELGRLVPETGIAAASLTRSSHAGALGLHVERLAGMGFVGLAFANSPSAMTAWGGRRGVFGTNPLAFAAPRRGSDPIVVDLALSKVARARIVGAAERGEPIPEGWAVDEHGRATTDAKAALRGHLLPIGDAKGAALSLVVEILVTALAGALTASETSSFLDAKGPPNDVGQLLIAIDPAGFAGADVFAERLGTLAAMIEADAPARLPGTRRLALRQAARREGVAVDAKVLAEVERLAG
jgi:(2R)-3-sulfolactate dehydrogenase (NADP+)